MGIDLMNFSSNTSNDRNTGSFYLNANNTTSNSNANIGSGTLLNKLISMVYSLLVVSKTNNKIPLSVGREIEGSGVTRESKEQEIYTTKYMILKTLNQHIKTQEKEKLTILKLRKLTIIQTITVT